MEKEIKRKAAPDINEEMMMNLMVDGVKKDGIQLPPDAIEVQEKQEAKQEEFSGNKTIQKDKKRTKRNLDGSYGDHFLKTHSLNKRGDKSIYIRQEYHERLSRIIQVIGKDEIPLYAYLDNILEHHFGLFEKAITDDFNEKFKPLF